MFKTLLIAVIAALATSTNGVQLGAGEKEKSSIRTNAQLNEWKDQLFKSI